MLGKIFGRFAWLFGYQPAGTNKQIEEIKSSVGICEHDASYVQMPGPDPLHKCKNNQTVTTTLYCNSCNRWLCCDKSDFSYKVNNTYIRLTEISPDTYEPLKLEEAVFADNAVENTSLKEESVIPLSKEDMTWK